MHATIPWTFWTLISVLVWFANVRLLSELSTPFVNLRWMLLQVNLKESIFYSINRKLTFYAFVLVRIMPIPIWWSAYAYHLGSDDFANVHILSKITILLSGLALDFLNITWCLKLAKGMKKKPAEVGGVSESGFQKSEDPTEGSVFARVNVRTRILINQMRSKSVEKIISVRLHAILLASVTEIFLSWMKNAESLLRQLELEFRSKEIV